MAKKKDNTFLYLAIISFVILVMDIVYMVNQYLQFDFDTISMIAFLAGIPLLLFANFWLLYKRR
jgi:hypothetical protein